MRVYKFLTADRRSPITGFPWPQSAWVVARGTLEPCRNGIHACRIRDLPHWIGADLWAIELRGDVKDAPNGVLAREGRLLERVAAWAGGVDREFADDCARRAQALAGDQPVLTAQAADAAANAAAGWVSASAYIVAVVTARVRSGSFEGPTYEEHFLAERARQARWLQERLGLE